MVSSVPRQTGDSLALPRTRVMDPNLHLQRQARAIKSKRHGYER